MADSNSTPDLQSILANLARFAPDAQPFEPPNNSDNIPHAIPTVPATHASPITAPPVTTEKVDDPRLRPQSRSTGSPKSIDPATITTWQDGLRCVTKIAAQNAQFAASIRRMIDIQKKSEMRWYAERQNLIQTQANRAKSSAQAQSILQSLSNGHGKKTDPKADVTNHEAGVRELVAFDRKIHASQVELEASTTTELKALGVPFFGTDQNLIVRDGTSSKVEVGRDNQPKWSPVVTEAELLDLRKRMVQHLEDLYRD